MTYKLKEIRKLAKANMDFFAANLTYKRLHIACGIVSVTEAVVVVEKDGKVYKYIPETFAQNYDSLENYQPAKIKFGGQFNTPSSFIIKINGQILEPDFVCIVVKFDSNASPFEGFSLFYHAQTPRLAEKFGSYYIESTTDAEAAFATAEKIYSIYTLQQKKEPKDEGNMTIDLK